MKIFISLSVFAMVLAGIYGFTDMANDIHNGTMIRYGEEAKTQQFLLTAHFAGFGKNAHRPKEEKIVIAVRVKEEKKKEKAAVVVEPKFSIEDISRGDPEDIEILPVEKNVAVDSAMNAADSSAVIGN